MRPIALGVAAVLHAATPATAAAELSFTTRAIGEARDVRPDSLFAPGLPLTNLGRERSRIEQELRGHAGPVSMLLTGMVSSLQGEKPRGELVINELYVDLGAGANRYTVGKKILSGGVGYGFRPIDVIQREVRRGVLPPTLEGIPHVAWEHFSAQAAWSLIYANPGRGRRAAAMDDEALALRSYHRLGDVDLHGVARLSSRHGIETGAAVSLVPSESLELHGSFLLQRRGERRVPLSEPASTAELLSAGSAVGYRTLDWPLKVLAGMTWTAAGGSSLLGEIWWDGTAPAAEDWRTLAGQTRRRLALANASGVPAAAIAGSLAASTRLFQAPNLTRKSVLLRYAWTDPAGGSWSYSADALYTPEDAGWVATAAAAWVRDGLRVDIGARRYGGARQSGYRLLPEKHVIFAGVSLAY